MLPVQNRSTDPHLPSSDEVSGIRLAFHLGRPTIPKSKSYCRGPIYCSPAAPVCVTVLAALIAIFSVVPNITAARAPLLAHAHFILGAAGFAWWLLAPYGWLGLLLMLVAVWLALRLPWPSAAALPG